MKATGLLAACLYGMAKQQMAAIRCDTVATPLARQADMIAAGWYAAQLLPRLAASFTAEMEDPMVHASFPGGLSGWLSSLSASCCNLCQPLLLVYSLPLVGCSPAQLASWLAAVAASLRLLPRMVALDARLKQHSSRFDGAEVGCGQLLRLPVVLLPSRLEQSQQQLEQLHSSTGELHPDDTAAWQSLQSQLWALHTSLCRLIAALTAPAAPLSVPNVQLTSLHWDSLILSLHSALHCILLAHAHEHPLHEARQARWSLAVIDSAPRYAAQASRLWHTCSLPAGSRIKPISMLLYAAPGAAAPTRIATITVHCTCSCREVLTRLRAICAGHVPAVRAAAAAAAALSGGSQPSVPSYPHQAALVQALLIVASVLPEAIEPLLLAPLELLVEREAGESE